MTSNNTQVAIIRSFAVQSESSACEDKIECLSKNDG